MNGGMVVMFVCVGLIAVVIAAIPLVGMWLQKHDEKDSPES